MMLSRLSIRARITLGSVVGAAVILGIALFAVRAQVGQILTDADASLARSDLVPFAADINAGAGEPTDEPSAGVLIYVRSPEGMPQVDTLPHEVHEIVEHRNGADEQFEARDHSGEFIVVGTTVENGEGVWSLWAARSTESSALAMRSLDALLLVGSVVLLGAFAAASWFLASAALRPVDRLRRGAESLAATSERSSLPVGPANDEIAELATTLNAFLDDVRESTEREKRMVSDAAHELRTPLAALKTELELARENSPDATFSTQLAEAEASVDRLTALATNLLELARLEQAAIVDERLSPADAEREFLAAVDRARLLALPRSVEVAFTLEDLHRTAGTSAISFSRLCDNLLANAVSAARGKVSASLTEEHGETVLRICDDGKGMPPAFIAKAFERFSRPDEARSSGGSGLGLSLVKAIVDAADGTVGLRNTSDGFEVEIRLPNM